MIAQEALVGLLHLGIQAVIHKFGPCGVVSGLVLDVQVNKLGAQADHARHGFDEVVAELVADAGAVVRVLVEGDGLLVAPGTGPAFYLDFKGFLFRLGAGFAPHLHGGVGHVQPVADLIRRGAGLVPYLQDALHAIAGDPLFIIIVGGIAVDLAPGMIGIVSGIAPAHRQIHGDDRIVVVVGIHRRLILHLYVVDAAGGLDIRALLHRRRVVPRPEIAGRQKQAKHGGSQQTGPLPPAACLLILHVLPILSQWRAASAV